MWEDWKILLLGYAILLSITIANCVVTAITYHTVVVDYMYLKNNLNIQHITGDNSGKGQDALTVGDKIYCNIQKASSTAPQ
jgi:ribosomal protein S1